MLVSEFVLLTTIQFKKKNSKVLLNDCKILFFKRNQSSAQDMQSSFVFEMLKTNQPCLCFVHQ